MKATLPTYLTCHQKETLRRVQNEARKAWWRDGHPGWGIWTYMSEEGLVKNVHSQVRLSCLARGLTCLEVPGHHSFALMCEGALVDKVTSLEWHFYMPRP